MKIALVCFAFLPHSGSEPGVGWRWASEMLASDWEVTVFLRQQHYNQTLASGWLSDMKGLKLVPVGNLAVENVAAKNPLLLYLYIYIWQVLVSRSVIAHHNSGARFDVFHHLTYGGIRIPSLLGHASVRTLLGPLGGGETAPWKMVRNHGLTATTKEVIRYLANLSNHVNPFVIRGFSKADRILIKTADNLRFIPKRFHKKTIALREIGVSEVLSPTPFEAGRSPKILFVARSLYWKGGALAIESFNIVRRTMNAELTMVGTGSDRRNWEQRARELGCDTSIRWIDRLDRSQMSPLYAEHDLFLFPSWHDSSGNVVLEAIASGLPVVSLNAGGPGEINSAAGGKVVDAKGKTAIEIANDLAQATTEILTSENTRREIIRAGQAFVKGETWHSKVVSAYSGWAAVDAPMVT